MVDKDIIKVIVTKGIIEKWTFEKMPNPSKKRSAKVEKTVEEWSEDKSGDRKKNSRKAKWNFMRLINNNFDETSKFMTLTYADNMTDVEQGNKDFNLFIKRLKHHFMKTEGFEDIVYAVAIEFQKRGAVHYHMLVNMPYIEKSKLAELWGKGFVKINKIKIKSGGKEVEDDEPTPDLKKVDNIAAYVSKYMTKEDKDVRLKGKKQFWASRNIEKPIEFKGIEADEIITIYGLDHMKTAIEKDYPSEHHGKITYQQYNLNRKSEEDENDSN